MKSLSQLLTALELRTTPLNRTVVPNPGGHYVLYWMQSSVRNQANHALELAIHWANQQQKPLLVLFALIPNYPSANWRHYQFLLEGLIELVPLLQARGVNFSLQLADPPTAVLAAARQATLVLCDGAYTRLQKQWQATILAQLSIPLLQVESDLVVPVTTAYPKEAYGARILRNSLQNLLPSFLKAPPQLDLKVKARLDFPTMALDLPALLAQLPIDRTVTPVAAQSGGERAARARLRTFIAHKLDRYHLDKNDPSLEGSSGLSAYLHFGHISALEIALEISKSKLSQSEGAEAFLEELIVRRELAFNYIYYNPHYESWAALPQWARLTLEAHAKDERDLHYTPKQLERARTHDPIWNACQNEMVTTGKMHGYLRMYWGKKILEWSPTPQQAWQTALWLNNRYQLDGRNANSFAGVAWCFGKHDQAWKERPIFGKVRYMNARGLERKFHLAPYLARYAPLI